MTRKLHRLSLTLPLLVIIFSGILTACSAGTSIKGQDLAMAPMEGMPQEVRSAPIAVQQAYEFAAANPEMMKNIPCYCGCGAIGHTSNYSCYVSSVESDGKVIFDTHALGCSICVDITQDAMRLLGQGKAVPEIKAYIDQHYSQYGPSNMP